MLSTKELGFGGMRGLSVDTPLGEPLRDRLNVLQTYPEVPFDTCPVNEEIYDNVGFVGRNRKLPQAFPHPPWIYARKIRNRIELAVTRFLRAYAAKMDPVLGRAVHVTSIGHRFISCRGRNLP